jgi:hypothetical protein
MNVIANGTRATNIICGMSISTNHIRNVVYTSTTNIMVKTSRRRRRRRRNLSNLM